MAGGRGRCRLSALIVVSGDGRGAPLVPSQAGQRLWGQVGGAADAADAAAASAAKQAVPHAVAPACSADHEEEEEDAAFQPLGGYTKSHAT